MTVVDVHTHLFNHRHLPVEGIARAFLYGPLGEPLAVAGGRLFRRLVTLLAADPETVRAVGGAARRALDPGSRDERPLRDAVVREATRRQWAGLRALGPPGSVGLGAALASDPWEVLAADIHEFLGEVAVERRDGARSPPPRTPARELASPGPRELAARNGVLRAFLALLSALEARAGFVAFVLALLGPVDDLWVALQRAHTTDDGVAVDLFVALMMDMQPGYDVDADGQPWSAPPDPPALPWPAMIDEMLALTWQAEGRIAGFVAFDPRRPDALDQVSSALGRGMVGVKLYPPMGYAPTDERLWPLYALCAENDVPILAHCSPTGFEAWPGFGTYSAPLGWSAVLDEHPSLRLCLGHAGSLDQRNRAAPDDPTEVEYRGWNTPRARWHEPGVRSYARDVVALCSRADRPNVYCDLSYFVPILERPADRRAVRRNLRALLGSPDLAGRFLYGSDWHMPETFSLADDVLRAFRRMKLPHAAGFFGENALRFLNLGGAADRVEAAIGAGRVDGGRARPTVRAWRGLAR